MPDINETIFYGVNGLAGSSKYLDNFFITITSDTTMVLVFLAALFFVFWDRRKTFVEKLTNKRVYYVLLTVIITMALIYVLKNIFKIPRPFEVLEGVNQLIAENTGVSFPSGHSAFIMSLATSVYFIHPEYRKFLFVKVLFVFAFLVIYSRVFVGVHYPFDVAVGALIGTIVAISIFKIFHKHLS